MLGVVLWSDSKDHKAVFWCEDHGDLAYYSQSDQSEPSAFCAGDLVCFDLTTEQDMRMARNPILLHGRAYKNLAQALPKVDAISDPIPKEPKPDNVIRFPLERCHTAVKKSVASQAPFN